MGFYLLLEPHLHRESLREVSRCLGMRRSALGRMPSHQPPALSHYNFYSTSHKPNLHVSFKSYKSTVASRRMSLLDAPTAMV